MGATLQAEGTKAIASLGYKRYGAYVSSVETIQVNVLLVRGIVTVIYTGQYCTGLFASRASQKFAHTIAFQQY